jgi:hypothetical protein
LVWCRPSSRAPRLHTVISIRGESCHQHDSIKNRRRNDWGHPWWWLRYSYDALLYSLNFFFSFFFFSNLWREKGKKLLPVRWYSLAMIARRDRNWNT